MDLPRPHLARAALLAMACLAPRPAGAAPYDGSQALDVYQGPVLSTARIVGLAGAYVGVAEGQDGQPFNVASLAQRDRRLDRPWDWDFVFTALTPALTQVHAQDFDNDGQLDRTLSGRSVEEVGLAFQGGRFGVGLLFDRLTFTAATPTGKRFTAVENDLSLGAAYGFYDESVILGGEVVLGGATFAGPAAVGTARADYSEPKLRAGLLVRPRDSFMRLGAQVEPGRVARRSGSEGGPFTENMLMPAGVSLPWVVRLGASAWVGPNASLYNARSPAAVREAALEARRRGQPEPRFPAPRDAFLRPVLIAAELDVVGASPDAVSFTDFVRQGTHAPIQPAGTHATVSPHLGAEWEALPRWIRLRGGSYLEPSRYAAPARAHGTGGLDLRIPFLLADLRASLGMDFAPRYQNLAFSLGLWRDAGPSGTVGLR